MRENSTSWAGTSLEQSVWNENSLYRYQPEQYPPDSHYLQRKFSLHFVILTFICDYTSFIPTNHSKNSIDVDVTCDTADRIHHIKSSLVYWSCLKRRFGLRLPIIISFMNLFDPEVGTDNLLPWSSSTSTYVENQLMIYIGALSSTYNHGRFNFNFRCDIYHKANQSNKWKEVWKKLVWAFHQWRQMKM